MDNMKCPKCNNQKMHRIYDNLEGISYWVCRFCGYEEPIIEEE
jgi:ribosomal protein L37AE/L43A